LVAVNVVELAPGLWRWTARHPDWTPEQGGPEGWEPEVASYYCEADDEVVLIDPIVPVGHEQFWRALDRDVERVGSPHVVLTCAWHARSSAAVIARYPGARLWVHADGAEALPAGVVATDTFRPGDRLPGGAQAVDAELTGSRFHEVLLWLPSHHALVCGDTFLGDAAGGLRLCPDSWLEGYDIHALRTALRERLDGLLVERVLVTHGEPVLEGARDALRNALE
jgi:glyoxylase-like metal-dependent hydrolase (beta-lactamase superfamily II)